MMMMMMMKLQEGRYKATRKRPYTLDRVVLADTDRDIVQGEKLVCVRERDREW